MNKQEFLEQLRRGISGLPQEDIEERLTFYSEMIDDRIEEGLSENEAVSEIGSVDTVISQILEDTPLVKLVKQKIRPKKRISAWEIVLLILGSPIWLSLIIAAFAVVISVYAAVWSLIIALWSVFVSLAAAALGGAAGGIWFAVTAKAVTGLAAAGTGVFCAGLSVFMFFACKAATKGILLLTKKAALGIKGCFMNRREA